MSGVHRGPGHHEGMSPLQRSDFEALLTVQQIDSELDRLRSRLEVLEAGRRSELVEAERAAATQLEDARGRLEEARRHQIRLEGALSDLEERAKQTDARLRQLSDAAQIDAAQRELDRAQRQASTTEDELLGAMEDVEVAEAALAEAEDAVASARRRREEAEGEEADERREVEAAIVAGVDRRDGAVAEVPAELVSAYEDRRSRGQKVAVARFEAGRCGSCHLTLPATEADRIRTAPDDAIVTCDDCNTILVRPPRRVPTGDEDGADGG